MTNVARAILVVALAGTATAEEFGTGGLTKIYVSNAVFSYIIEIDTTTLERRYLELYDYPYIIKATDLVVEPEGSILIEVSNALQQEGIYRFYPSSGIKEPVTGHVDEYTSEPLGSGPLLEPLLNTLILGDPGEIIALRYGVGPVLVNLRTGDRMQISQSTEPRIGNGHPMQRPLDMVRLPSGDLLVVEDFEGIIHIEEHTGDRTLAYANSAFTLPPWHIELLNDGRLVYTAGEAEVGAVFVFDPETSTSSILSGSFGGITVGKGEEIHSAGDIAVGYDGMVYLYDLGTPAILRVDPETGVRTVLASPAVGAGEPLVPASFRPVLFAQRRRFVPDAWIVQ